MPKKQSFRTVLDRFVQATAEEFRVEQLLTYARPKIRTTPPDFDDAARALLRQHPEVFHDPERDVFISHAAYFRNAVCRIVPIDLELSEGVLVFGHRTIPFGPYGADANESSVVLAGGREIKRKKVNWTIDQYRQFYTLLGPEIMMQSLLLSDPANAGRLAGAPTPGTRLRLTVFDLREVYQKQGFKPGDALVLKVLRFAPPRYELTVQTSLETAGAEDRVQDWQRRFDEGLNKAFDLLGTNTVAYAQISLACFLAGRSLLENPFGSPLLCLRSNPNLELQSLETHSYIWPKDRDPNGPAPEMSHYPVSVGDSDSLDEILDDTGAPISASAIEAYMRDALFRGRQDLNPILDRAFGTLRTPEFYDDYQRQAFDKQLRQLWADVRSGYSRTTDHYAGKCRSIVLAAVDDYFELLQDVDDRELTEEQEELVRSAVPLLRSCYSFLASLNVPIPGPDSLDRDLLSEAQDIAAEIKDLARRILETISGDPAHRRGEVIDGEKRPHAVRIKVTLEDVEPAVWRRVLLPADSTLADLHIVIQIAFRWESEHDHYFVIGDRRYSSAALADGRRMEEEDECFLEELTPDQYRFKYIYGYEGTWVHTVEIEDMKAPNLGFTHPICLDGQRACPPEDSHPDSYRKVAAALRDPTHPDYAEAVRWAGYPLDPDAFDRNVANQELIEQWRGYSGPDEDDEAFDPDDLDDYEDADDWEDEEEDEDPD